MKWFVIMKAKRNLRRLYQMMKLEPFETLPIKILYETDIEIGFRYCHHEGKILKEEGHYTLYTLFDIYHKGRLIKGAYRINFKKRQMNSEMKEFSRSGISIPGPC